MFSVNFPLMWVLASSIDSSGFFPVSKFLTVCDMIRADSIASLFVWVIVVDSVVYFVRRFSSL